MVKLLVKDGLDTILKEREMGRASPQTTDDQIIEYRNRLLYWAVLVKDVELVQQLLASSKSDRDTSVDIMKVVTLSGKGE